MCLIACPCCWRRQACAFGLGGDKGMGGVGETAGPLAAVCEVRRAAGTGQKEKERKHVSVGSRNGRRRFAKAIRRGCSGRTLRRGPAAANGRQQPRASRGGGTATRRPGAPRRQYGSMPSMLRTLQLAVAALLPMSPSGSPANGTAVPTTDCSGGGPKQPKQKAIGRWRRPTINPKPSRGGAVAPTARRTTQGERWRAARQGPCSGGREIYMKTLFKTLEPPPPPHGWSASRAKLARETSTAMSATSALSSSSCPCSATTSSEASPPSASSLTASARSLTLPLTCEDRFWANVRLLSSWRGPQTALLKVAFTAAI